ncbi:MAG: HD domain-containing protein [Pseudomonadales bacterium]|nr:HD domain-containing protein [Pseudomonadales bacterium]
MFNLIRCLLFSLCFIAGTYVIAQETPSGIPLDAQWKQTVYEFVKENQQHSAWGLAHSERDYVLALDLAEREGLEIDPDVLFAAAFLHDMGAFAPYASRGSDHSQVAADSMAEILEPAGFPMEKLPLVQGAALAHMYYSPVPDEPHAQVLHDADTLNFLGAVGVTRIISLTTREGLAQDLPTAIATLENMGQQLPATLVLDASKQMGQLRLDEMNAFINALLAQSAGGRAL